MNRRAFVTGLGAVLAAPLGAGATQSTKRTPTVGVLATTAAMEATRTIPIVFVAVSHPIEAGFVQSLARPGGNVTGVTNQASDLTDKQLQLARDVASRLSHVGIVWAPVDPGSARGFKDAQ